MTPKPNNEWEKEFDEIAYPIVRSTLIGDEAAMKQLKSFIHSLLSSERQRLREEIEKEKWLEHTNEARIHNQALSDILKLLEE